LTYLAKNFAEANPASSILVESKIFFQKTFIYLLGITIYKEIQNRGQRISHAFVPLSIPEYIEDPFCILSLHLCLFYAVKFVYTMYVCILKASLIVLGIN